MKTLKIKYLIFFAWFSNNKSSISGRFNSNQLDPHTHLRVGMYVMCSHKHNSHIPTFGCDISNATIIMGVCAYKYVSNKTKHNKTSATLLATFTSLIILALDMFLRITHKSSNDTDIPQKCVHILLLFIRSSVSGAQSCTHVFVLCVRACKRACASAWHQFAC